MLGNDQKSVWPDVRSDRRKACRFAPNEPDVWPRPSINFTDSQLQKCYESNLAEAADLSSELRQVRALIAVYDLFQMLEGPHSSRVHETVWRLLLPKLRPGLRRWYQRFGADKNPAAIALRDHLSQLAGEKLENVTDIPHNPS